MKFWDSSAIVPLVVNEERTDYCFDLMADDPGMLVWRLSRIEVVSAMCRGVREGVMGYDEFLKAMERLGIIMNKAVEISAVEKVRSRALRLRRYIHCGRPMPVSLRPPW